MAEQYTDCIIIGGGTAGLTAALYLLRAGKQVTVIEKQAFGGQIVTSDCVENFPTIRRISGMEYADLLVDQVLALGCDVTMEEVLEIQPTEQGFTVRTDSRSYHARGIILATGAKHRSLNLPDEKNWIGKGLSYCAVCDGAFFRDRDVVVVGGGNTAIQSALFLSDVCKQVTVVHRRAQYRAHTHTLQAAQKRDNIRFMTPYVVHKLIGTDDALQAVELVDPQDPTLRETVRTDGLFVTIGQIPQNEFVRDLVELDAEGYIAAGEDCATSCPGIYVAGDCRTKQLRQLTTAASDGAVAAMALCEYLNARD